MTIKNCFSCLFLALILVFTGCNSTKFTTDNLPETQLIFGNGGGVAGFVNQYLLLENGQLFEKRDPSNSFTELSKVKKKKAASFFARLDAMSFEELELDQPGNIYRFIQLKTPALDHKITWGKSDYEVDAQVESLYKDLIALVKKD